MKKYLLLAVIAAAMILSGCASGGTKYIALRYTGTGSGAESGKIAVAPFTDSRPGIASGYIGTRYIGKKKKEVYTEDNHDLAAAVTNVCGAYLRGLGFDTVSIGRWSPAPDTMGIAPAGTRYLVTGQIQKFDCFAVKKIGFTSMILEIKIVFYVGDPAAMKVKRIPIELKLERNEFTFSPKKLEKFMDQCLDDVLGQALHFGKSAES